MCVCVYGCWTLVLVCVGGDSGGVREKQCRVASFFFQGAHTTDTPHTSRMHALSGATPNSKTTWSVRHSLLPSRTAIRRTPSRTTTSLR